MKVIDLINSSKSTAFSFEILPPLKGNSIQKVYNVIDKLIEFDPKYINITSHHSEYIYKTLPDGSFQKVNIRKRPGSVDLNFLGVYDLLLLRGDVKTLEAGQKTDIYHEHATDLQQQVNDFNKGIAIDGSVFEANETPFSYGMACYPEKHEEAPNMESDIFYLKEKVKNGADYLVTQMFFDNEKYYAFVDRCRAEGITVPIIPGIKPIVFKNQLTVLPKIFRSDIPEPFATELRKCKTDDEAKAVGVEWCIQQCKDLIAHGVPSLHFYTMMASDSVYKVAKEVY